MKAASLTEAPIGKLIAQLAIPGALGFFFHTMFNVVDTFYAAQISSNALAALSLSFPLYFCVVALGLGFGNAATALVGHSLGASNHTQAKQLTAQVITLNTILSILIGFGGYLSMSPLIESLGMPKDAQVHAEHYMVVIFLGSASFTLVGAAYGILTACGDTRSFRNFLVAGALGNAVLDPLFITLFPHLGLGSIALATVIIEALGAGYLLYKVWEQGLIANDLSLFTPNWKHFRALAHHGIPSSANFLGIAAGAFIIVWLASVFGTAPVAAYGLASRIEQVVLLPIIGLNMAALGIISQNMGAKKTKRAYEAFETCILLGLILSSLGSIVLQLFGSLIASWFTEDPQVLYHTRGYLNYAQFTLWAYAIIFISSATLQAIKMPLIVLGFGLSRQVLFPLLLFPILIESTTLNVSGLWLGIVAVNWAAGLGSVFIARKFMLASSRTNLTIEG
jgi:putative MATE family efflux protein